jgi:hypothetical protein
MTACQYADHPMTAELGKMQALFPLVSPMDLVEPAPEGISLTRLVWLPENEGLWSVQDISFYERQQANEFYVRSPEDSIGEFLMAAAATKGNAKVVVINSTEFATDRIAGYADPVLIGQRIAMRLRFPGNAALFMNALHWLNDNIKWMNLGTPIDTSTLAVQEGSGSMKFVWALTVFILPALAMCGGICVWFVRRR